MVARQLVKEILKLVKEKEMKKYERWVVKWSQRNESFEDKKRVGRPDFLNETAKIVLKKAKYKRRKSIRQLSQQLTSKGLFWGGNTVWMLRLAEAEGWRPMRQQKKPLITDKQRAGCLRSWLWSRRGHQLMLPRPAKHATMKKCQILS